MVLSPGSTSHSSQVDPFPQLLLTSNYCHPPPLSAATHSIRWLRSSSVRSRAPPVRSACSGAFSQSLSAASDGDSNTSSV